MALQRLRAAVIVVAGDAVVVEAVDEVEPFGGGCG